MQAEAIEPHGLALLDYYHGNNSAALVIRRDDGCPATLPVGHFFRAPDAFSAIENMALDLCKGRVLDVGAGSGLHSLVLQARGLAVTAMDVSHHAVQIMSERGLADVHCADIFHFTGGPFDTLLMMGHGIGMVENIAGLDRLLQHAGGLLVEGGQVLLDSVDVRKTDDPANLAYQEANRRAGRYIGEIRLQFEYQGQVGPTCGWLHVDAGTLGTHAKRANWQCEVVRQEQSGDYLARLTKQQTA